MGRGKLVRFAYNQESRNVVEPGKPIFDVIKGNWNTQIFNNDNPITLELGCGRGEYTLGLAKLFPEKNFIGVDIKGSRIWKGAKTANEEGLGNVAFLRTHILNTVDLFTDNEVEEIWLTFPDPRMKDGDERKRLISPRFLDLYKQYLKPGSIINLKTDNFFLYEYADELVRSMGLEVLASTSELYGSDVEEQCYNITTTYEKKFLFDGGNINYLKFKLD